MRAFLLCSFLLGPAFAAEDFSRQFYSTNQNGSLVELKPSGSGRSNGEDSSLNFRQLNYDQQQPQQQQQQQQQQRQQQDAPQLFNPSDTGFASSRPLIEFTNKGGVLVRRTDSQSPIPEEQRPFNSLQRSTEKTDLPQSFSQKDNQFFDHVGNQVSPYPPGQRPPSNGNVQGPYEGRPELQFPPENDMNAQPQLRPPTGPPPENERPFPNVPRGGQDAGTKSGSCPIPSQMAEFCQPEAVMTPPCGSDFDCPADLKCCAPPCQKQNVCVFPDLARALGLTPRGGPGQNQLPDAQQPPTNTTETPNPEDGDGPQFNFPGGPGGPGPQFPGPGQQNPGPGQQFPGPGQQNPGPGQQNPGPGQQFPGPGPQYPGPGQQNPGAGQQFPGPGPQFPGPGQQFPGPGQQFPGPGQPFPGGPGPQFPGPYGPQPGEDNGPFPRPAPGYQPPQENQTASFSGVMEIDCRTADLEVNPATPKLMSSYAQIFTNLFIPCDGEIVGWRVFIVGNTPGRTVYLDVWKEEDRQAGRWRRMGTNKLVTDGKSGWVNFAVTTNRISVRQNYAIGLHYDNPRLLIDRTVVGHLQQMDVPDKTLYDTISQPLGHLDLIAEPTTKSTIVYKRDRYPCLVALVSMPQILQQPELLPGSLFNDQPRIDLDPRQLQFSRQLPTRQGFYREETPRQQTVILRNSPVVRVNADDRAAVYRRCTQPRPQPFCSGSGDRSRVVMRYSYNVGRKSCQAFFNNCLQQLQDTKNEFATLNECVSGCQEPMQRILQGTL